VLNTHGICFLGVSRVIAVLPNGADMAPDALCLIMVGCVRQVERMGLLQAKSVYNESGGYWSGLDENRVHQGHTGRGTDVNPAAI
jgi:hypothetical protein